MPLPSAGDFLGRYNDAERSGGGDDSCRGIDDEVRWPAKSWGVLKSNSRFAGDGSVSNMGPGLAMSQLECGNEKRGR